MVQWYGIGLLPQVGRGRGELPLEVTPKRRALIGLTPAFYTRRVKSTIWEGRLDRDTPRGNKINKRVYREKITCTTQNQYARYFQLQ